jgi:hypothetical protein
MQIWRKVLVIICFKCCALEAIPTVVPDPIPCVTDLELKFFEETYLKQGLSAYGFRQELWNPVWLSLQKKSLEVPERMKRRTAYLVPNPLEYPMQREEAAKVLLSVLFEVFQEVMRFYYVNERPTADFVFNYIFSKQMPNLVRCFGPEVMKLEQKFD